MFAYLKADLAAYLADHLTAYPASPKKLPKKLPKEPPEKLQAHQMQKLLQRARNPQHGHIALPVFSLASSPKTGSQQTGAQKTGAQKPVELAQHWAQYLQQQLLTGPHKFNAHNLQISQLGGFVNFRFSAQLLQQSLKSSVLQTAENKIGHQGPHTTDKIDKTGKTAEGIADNVGDDITVNTAVTSKNKTLPGTKECIVIDFASPNVAKPMHIGHLRASLIGQAIVNLAHTQGHKSLGLNHLGDWGVQFGKLIWAYKQWAAGERLDLEGLYTLYVRFHKEAKNKPELNVFGSAEFKKLEQGDPATLKLWREFVDISMQEYNILWQGLKVQHDQVLGESFYNDHLQDVKNRLHGLGLLVEDQGARVVMLPDSLPPCLIEKTDGASLYATRDLASAIYRFEHLGATQNLYVVGSEQKLHFKQVFCVLKKMGFKWASQCRHIDFGRYRFKDTRLSSREGQVVRLKDVLDEARNKVLQRLNDDSDTAALPEGEKLKLAQQIGQGAVVFNDLKTDRSKDVEFDWNKILSLQGDTGPYVQYAGVRCRALISKYLQQNSAKPLTGTAQHGTVDLDDVNDFQVSLEPRDHLEPTEHNLIVELLQFADVLSQAFQSYKPHIVASYLLSLCKAFNQFYTECKILSLTDEAAKQHRMALVKSTYLVLRQGLKILNIDQPPRM